MQNAIEFLNGIKSDADALINKLQTVEKFQEQISALTGANGKEPVAAVPTNGKAKPVSDKRVLQGKYMGAIRHLPETEKAKVKAIKEAKGFRAAIAEARRIAKAATAAQANA